MDSSKPGKRKTDYTSGEDHRDEVIQNLNTVLLRHRAGISFRRANIKLDNCRQKGLDYVLFKLKDKDKKILFMFGDLEVGGFYIKAEGITNDRESEVYLDGLAKKDYHVILIDESGEKLSRVIPMNPMIMRWPHRKHDNENNANRIQFYGNWGDITCLDPEEPFGFEPPLWMQLKWLFK